MVLFVTGCGAAHELTEPTGQTASAHPDNDFVRRIVGDTEDVWTQVFPSVGSRYDPPKVVLFKRSIPSSCGIVFAASGPFYCVIDRTLYLDTAYLSELPGAARGDFGKAYLIVHEISHHVQNALGTMVRSPSTGSGLPARERDEVRVRLELQADCYTGIWAFYVRKRHLIEPGDLNEARAAQALGDASTHGSAAQRSWWFEHGLASGNPMECDTFKVSQP